MRYKDTERNQLFHGFRVASPSLEAIELEFNPSWRGHCYVGGLCYAKHRLFNTSWLCRGAIGLFILSITLNVVLVN